MHPHSPCPAPEHDDMSAALSLGRHSAHMRRFFKTGIQYVRDQIPQLLCCAMEAESLWTIGYFTDPCWQRASATMMQGIDSTV